MQLIHLFTATTLTLGVTAAPSAFTGDKTSSDTNVARGWGGYGGCGWGGYFWEDRCYCHQRNYCYNNDKCEYYCFEDAWYDYENECCSCYNDYEYSEEWGCRGY
ncbi:hypothetical protein LIA77_05335 [Sarocladium implicatum]|jgi:hypothetical protein|nr:hypothetical protein LIA77_05335 [Sarocladium implicatum]